MSDITDKPNKNPIILLVAIGIALSAGLFYGMMWFAEEQNLIMVILTASAVGLLAVAITKLISYYYQTRNL
ncbi:conserved hypothetical protein [Methanohalobium evestigatum Z-7303]|uniref:Uncharacterized protein n=1 Tax=Methanohalobium evestigatum (strain ATCC BAA-1072 / DSM 3721 / NBRC 107634 / OCM 161 / Z-7303) TaxID=644295 RepID=D7E914_METEZ|nr:hypothetical protein [Methanohalobium evestigatum]ADI73962.1 conserved hypothetical protein [Methanohalobium evestigatum Z-7303]